MTTLNAILLILLAFVCGFVILLSLRQRIGMIQYPFFAAAVVAGWALPQLVGLATNNQVPPEATSKTIFYMILCLIAGYLGYTRNKSEIKSKIGKYNYVYLVFASAILSLTGAYFHIQVNELAEEATAVYGYQWAGVITIYSFLSNLLTIGLVIAVTLFIHKPRASTLVIILFCTLFFVYRVVILGRREDAVEFFFVGIYALWFWYRWVPPRILILVAVVVGALFVSNTGEYRNTMVDTQHGYSWTGAGIKDVSAIDYTGNFLNVSDPYYHKEVLNAAMVVEATDRLKEFDLGTSFWNSFISYFVPGQLVGPNVKRSLMLTQEDVAYKEFFHTPYTGSTQTGLADTFRSFWYFGCLVFFLIGYIMSYWFRAAQAGNPIAQMMVMLISAKSLLAITHNTHLFFLEFVTLGVFLVPVLVISQIRSGTKGDRHPEPELSSVSPA